MSDLMIDYITSLDGFGSAEGWPGLWGMGGPEYFSFLAEEAEKPYTVLMGANTYRLFAEFARTGAEDMGELTARPKRVFSSTLTEPLEWEGSTLVRGDAVHAVRELKAGAVDLRTVGSPALCRALLRAGLVDRIRVVMFPVVNGETGADRLYDGWPAVTLEPLRREIFDGRLQLCEYRPTVLERPPGVG